jgi:hypothetical protein
MADRGEVKLRQGNIDTLIDLYKRVYAKLVGEIVGATEAGKIQRAAVLARINQELEGFGVDVAAWVQKEMPQYYLDGANVAMQDLRGLGIDVTKSGLAAINQEAVKYFTDEVSLAFAEGIRGISRKAEQTVSEALKVQLNFIIAEGKLSGSTRKVIGESVRQRIAEEGLGVLRDRGGHKWEFGTYANMLVRTKAVEARNFGLTNVMLVNGYDLVQVSNHNTTHEACNRWESKILSLTGRTKVGTKLPGGYVVAGTVTEARSKGLFHPNCRHAINVLQPSLAAKTKAYDNPYNKLSPEERKEADDEFRKRVRSTGQE